MHDLSGIPIDVIKTEIEAARKIDPEVLKLIEQLKLSYKLAILSNAGREEIAVLYDNGIDKLFDTILISQDCGLIKPDPKIYELCVQRLGTSADQCLFIDDSSENVSVAGRVGMATIHYETFGIIPPELKSLVQLRHTN